MRQTDKVEFVKLLNLCYVTLGKPLPPVESLELWLTILEPYSIEQVRVALSAHMRESKFAPVPADVTSRLPKESDGRPEVDEAWAISLRSRDERDTVVWTQECAEAFAAAAPVLELGDDVGARMAFKAAYARIVERNRAAGTPAQWLKSLGHDPERREAALAEAVRAGRLQLEDVRAVVPLLGAPEQAVDPAVADANLARLRQMVGGIPSSREKLARIHAARTRADLESIGEAKRRAAERVATYEASQS